MSPLRCSWNKFGDGERVDGCIHRLVPSIVLDPPGHSTASPLNNLFMLGRQFRAESILMSTAPAEYATNQNQPCLAGRASSLRIQRSSTNPYSAGAR